MFLLRYIGIFSRFNLSVRLGTPILLCIFHKKTLPKVTLRERQYFVYSLFLKSCLKSIKLMAKLTRQLVAELLVVLLNLGALLLP